MEKNISVVNTIMNNYILSGIKADNELSMDILTEMQSDKYTQFSKRDYWASSTCRTLDLAYNEMSETIFRMDGSRPWKWKNNKIAMMVKELVEPFIYVYEHLTRVVVLIQKPGYAVPTHRDLITGQEYDGEVCIRSVDVKGWFKYKSDCKANPHTHKQQHFWGGRLALGPQSASYTIIDDTKEYYETGNEFFYLKETAYHGADIVNYWRGVIFFDGIYTMEQVDLFDKKG